MQPMNEGNTDRNLLLFFAAFLLSLSLCVNPKNLSENFFGDASTYYLMTQSLARDYDLRWTPKDYNRCFQDWQRPPEGVILMTPDHGKNVFYGKPFLYGLLAAPFYKILGIKAFFFLNSLLFVAILVLGYSFAGLEKRRKDAFLTVLTFFVLSVPFAYLSWVQPEIFTMFLIALGYYLWIGRLSETARAAGEKVRTKWHRDILIGLLFACVGFVRYFNAILFFPPFLYGLLKKQWKSAARMAASFLALFCLFHLVQFVQTGIVSPYYADRRAFSESKSGFPLVQENPDFWNPEKVPFLESDRHKSPESGIPKLFYRFREKLGLTKGFGQFGALPLPADFRPVFYNLLFFFIGRHSGIVWYFFPCILCLIDFLRRPKRGEMKRVLLLVFILLTMLCYLVFVRWNYCGGAGFIGNRYFLSLYMALFFLLPEPFSFKKILVSWIVAGVFLGQILLSPFGIPAGNPGEGLHTANFPFRLLPFETTLAKIPDAEPKYCPPYTIRLADRNAHLDGRFLTLKSNSTSELLIYARKPLTNVSLMLQTLSGSGEIAIKDWGKSMVVDFKTRDPASRSGNTRKIEFLPSHALYIHAVEWIPTNDDELRSLYYIYALRFETSSGAIKTSEPGRPSTCPGFRIALYQEKNDYSDPNFYRARLFDPPRLPEFYAGSTQEFRLHIINEGAGIWSETLFNPVRVSYRWLDEKKSPVDVESLRSPLPRTLAPGQDLEVPLEVVAPIDPGRFLLVLDLVCENEFWFAEMSGKPLFEAEIEVKMRPEP